MEKNLIKDAKEASVLLLNKTVNAVRNVSARYRSVLSAGFFALLSQTANAVSKLPEDERDITGSKTNIKNDDKVDFENTINFAEATTSHTVKSHDKYNGVDMKFSEMEAPDIGHLFESGMNPYVMGSNRYLGLYQMDIGSTMDTFFFGLKQKNKVIWPGIKKDYPKLVKLGKNMEARRSKAFITMFGNLSKTKEFRQKMDNYMRIVKYEPVYASLRKIPELDFDTRGKVFLATVMSATNQNPLPKVIAGIYETALHRAKAQAAKQKRNVTTADIIKNSYDVRKEKWGLANRYKEECRLALDWLNFEETMERIRKAKAKHAKKRAEHQSVIKQQPHFAQINSLATPKKTHHLLPQKPLPQIIVVKGKKGR